MTVITGIALAAGAGTRFGMPKALVRTAAGEPWLARATTLLLAAGCERVIVVLGASATEALELVPTDDRIAAVVAERWAEGMSESLRTGLAAASGTAALVTLVDLPELPVSVALRVAAGEVRKESLRQAVFAGRPGHPVLIGRAHWAALSAELAGDRGARNYLRAHGVESVESGDLFDGHDIDRRNQ